MVLGSGTTKGVDADVADAVTKENLDTMVQFAKDFAQTTGSIIAITGAIDLVADSENVMSSTMAVKRWEKLPERVASYLV